MKDIQIKDFTYELPENRIAKYPLPERDSSKLLVYRNGKIEESTYTKVDTFISEDSLLIFNNTKVIQARLNFKNSRGARIEIFCLEPAESNPEFTSAMGQKVAVEWHCFIGRLVKWKERVITKQIGDLILDAEIVGERAGVFTVRFSWHPDNLSFSEILISLGEMPIPPYLKRVTESIDVNRYQTVYAIQDGSVAAPTAGLHFTGDIFNRLKERSIVSEYVTLHVGAGTFKPVKSERIADHEMHFEWIDVSLSSIEKILKHISFKEMLSDVIAVGTTSLRTIETLYWMGVKAFQNPDATIGDLEINQWDAYDLPQNIHATDSMNSLLSWMNKKKLPNLLCKTQILIAPPYTLRIAKALITNFHQPNSTLLLLVAAVVGEDWKRIYDYALSNNFRFLSYGDGSLLFSNVLSKKA